MADGQDLDALVRRVDPDRWLSSRFITDPERRADVIALYAYDHELARAEIVASNPLIAEIRLTWWREALDEIYAGGLVRAHPTARALLVAVRRRDLPREPLEAMIDGRIGVLGRMELGADEMAAWADDVGGSMVVLASRILDSGSSLDAARIAGRAWGLRSLRQAAAAPGLRESTNVSLRAAKAASRQISAAAFPAVAHVALANGDLDTRSRSPFMTRLLLLIAVTRGRL